MPLAPSSNSQSTKHLYLQIHNPINITSNINRSLTLEYASGLNLPERIIHPVGHIRNYYTPAGLKTGKKVFDASNNLLSQELYYGDLIIKDGRATRILHRDGVVNLSGKTLAKGNFAFKENKQARYSVECYK